MKTETFRIDWYPREAFMGMSKLPLEEIGVLTQIINLIYSRNSAIENDPKFIGKNCNIGAKKCSRIINSLIHKERLYVTSDNKIHHHRCELELERTNNRRKKSTEDGRKGSEKRWKKEEKQPLNSSNTKNSALASTKTNNNTNTSTFESDARRGGFRKIDGSRLLPKDRDSSFRT